jgi:hypothetical protein
MTEPRSGERTLEELEGVDWGEPPFGSHLVTECHRLRRVPLQDLRPEDLRLLLGQQIGAEYLTPLALEVLAADPWTSGDLYGGDLLAAVLKLPAEFWSAHPELRAWLGQVVTEALRTKGPGDRDPDVVRRLHAWSRTESLDYR